MKQLSSTEIAAKQRHVHLLQKIRDNKTLTAAEIKELNSYERIVPQRVSAPQLDPAASRNKLASQLKSAARNGLEIADAELQLNIKSLNDVFEKKPVMRAAWERGRFLRALEGCSASAASISDAEHDLNMSAGELENIFRIDSEARDVWNESLIKTRNLIRRKLVEKAEDASPAALKQMYVFLSRQVAPASFDYTHIPGKIMEEIIAKTRNTIYVWVTEKGCPRNADNSFNLMEFFAWYEKYLTDKTPIKDDLNSLQIEKAKQIRMELDVRRGSLLERPSVIKGLVARAQTMLSIFTKFIGAETDPYIKERLNSVFEAIRRELARNLFDIKLNEKQQAMLQELCSMDDIDKHD